MSDATVKHRIRKVKKPIRGGMMIDVQCHRSSRTSFLCESFPSR